MYKLPTLFLKFIFPNDLSLLTISFFSVFDYKIPYSLCFIYVLTAFSVVTLTYFAILLTKLLLVMTEDTQHYELVYYMWWHKVNQSKNGSPSLNLLTHINHLS
jgi:hypothetical protein